MNSRFAPVVTLFAIFLLVGVIFHLFARPADPHYAGVRACSQGGGVWIPGDGVCAR